MPIALTFCKPCYEQAMRRLLALLAIVSWIAGPVAAQTDVDARVFVNQLYGAYHDGGPDYLGRQAGAVFSPYLLRLIRRDRARTPPGDAPDLDGDPICDCQDFAGLKLLAVKIEGSADGNAIAAVRFRMGTEQRKVVLLLTRINRHWLISDIQSADMPSLLDHLRKHAGGR